MKDWKDQTLIEATRMLLLDERRINIEIIRHLQEIERRRLFAKRGFSTLWRMLVEFYRCSESSANQRIAVLRLFQEVPEAEPLLANGKISFSTFAEVGRVARKLGKDPRILLEKISGKTCREAESILLAYMPTKNYREALRAVPGGVFELRLILSEEQRNSWEKLRALRSHNWPGHASLLADLLKLGLEKYDPMTQPSQPTSGVTNSYSIPESTRLFIWQRDKGQCTYVDNLTGKKCGSPFFLQVDHILPRSLGGTNDPSNLRLYCQAHNLLAAAEIFGEEKIKGRPTANSGAAPESSS